MEKVTKANKSNGDILLGFRKQNKMTQKELAEIIGRDQRDISKYECGLRAIPQNSVELLNNKYKLKLKSTGKVLHATRNPKLVDLAINPNSSFSKENHDSLKGSNFHKRLINLRNKLNLSQEQFAKKFKISLLQLRKLEKGTSDVLPISFIKALKRNQWDIYEIIR